MNGKKSNRGKIIWITVSVTLAALAVLFLTLGLTVWRPKSEREWLDDFARSLSFERESNFQKTERKIVIEENAVEKAVFEQVVEISDRSGTTIAHLYTSERYRTEAEHVFDVEDEYYLIGNTMYLHRIGEGEDVTTKFASTRDIFWQTVEANLGLSSYRLDRDALDSILIEHTGGRHILRAVVKDVSKFFGDVTTASGVSNVEIGYILDDRLTLASFSMTYRLDESQDVTTTVVRTEPNGIVLPDFVTQN